MIEPIKPKSTLAGSEIQDGDIITVQKSLSEKESVFPLYFELHSLSNLVIRSQALLADGRFLDAREYYDWILNRVNVEFVPKLESDNEDGTFTLQLSRKLNYDQFAAAVGKHLGVEPTHLRFTTINASNGRPKMPVKRGPSVSLHQILFPTSYTYGNNSNQRSDQLYYEVLEISLSELETRKTIKINWLPEGITKEETYEVLVIKNGNIGDVLAGLQKKAGILDEVMQDVRIYEVHGNKFYKALPSEYSIMSLNDYFVLYAEKIPEEEKTDEQKKYISVFHFDKEPNKTHHIPFQFMLKEVRLFLGIRNSLASS